MIPIFVQNCRNVTHIIIFSPNHSKFWDPHTLFFIYKCSPIYPKPWEPHYTIILEAHCGHPWLMYLGPTNPNIICFFGHLTHLYCVYNKSLHMKFMSLHYTMYHHLKYVSINHSPSLHQSREGMIPTLINQSCVRSTNVSDGHKIMLVLAIRPLSYQVPQFSLMSDHFILRVAIVVMVPSVLFSQI